MVLNKQIGFYFVLPAIVGLILGGNQAGIAGYLPWSWSVVYWLGMSLGVWIIFHVSTLAAAHLLRPWTGALLVILVAGALVGSIPARAAIYWYSPFFEPFLLHGRTVRPMPPLDLSWSFVARHLQLWSPIFVLWIAANAFADRFLGLPRYRLGERAGPTTATESTLEFARTDETETHVASASSPSAAPTLAPALGATAGLLLSRLPPALGRTILALKAEDHYVRVFTDKGDTLVLCRINDAIAELESGGVEGLRVHRSWWVALKAVRRVEAQGRGLQLTLCNHVQVPVSQTYKEFVRRAGFIDRHAGAENAAHAAD